MVEATAPASSQPAPVSPETVEGAQTQGIAQPSAPQVPPAQPQAPQTEISMCEHEDLLATYCRIHDIALCNDCYFDYHSGCGRGMTLK